MEYTIDEVRGYLSGVADVIDGDVPRELFDKILDMLENVEEKEVVQYVGGPTIIERRRPYWYGDYVTCDSGSNNSSAEAYRAMGAADAESITGR